MDENNNNNKENEGPVPDLELIFQRSFEAMIKTSINVSSAFVSTFKYVFTSANSSGSYTGSAALIVTF